MPETEGTVTISLERFKKLESTEQAFYKIKDGDKVTFIEIEDYHCYYKIYSTDEAIRTIIEVYEKMIDRKDKRINELTDKK